MEMRPNVKYPDHTEAAIFDLFDQGLGKSPGTASSCTMQGLSRASCANSFAWLYLWDALHHNVCYLGGPQPVKRPSCDTGQTVVTSVFHSRGLPAAAVAIGFAVVARTMGGVTDGGAIVGTLAAFVLMAAAGIAGVGPLEI